VFSLSHIPSELVLDFKGHATRKVVQNGEEIGVNSQEGFLWLEAGKLKVGRNDVGVHYDNRYDNDGSGCISYVDVDGKQYVSTQFAPYYANRVFPCFDQPDLKGKMGLSVIAPSDWKKVLSNEEAVIQMSFNL
jgi:aminopeptidase N